MPSYNLALRSEQHGTRSRYAIVSDPELPGSSDWCERIEDIPIRLEERFASAEPGSTLRVNGSEYDDPLVAGEALIGNEQDGDFA
jgi:hypothetical protein